jgi:hypothetical protein
MIMKKGLFAIWAAGTLMILQTGSAPGSESTVGLVRSTSPVSGQALPLPPVPYLDTMPWVNSRWNSPGQKVDMLLPPKPGDLPRWLEQTPALPSFPSAALQGANRV